MKKNFAIHTVLPANAACPNGLPFDGNVASVSAAWNAIRNLRDWDQVPTESLVGTRVTVQEEVMDDENGQTKTLLAPAIDIIFTMSTKGKILFTDYNKYVERLAKKADKDTTSIPVEN